MIKYFVSIDADGKIIHGMAIDTQDSSFLDFPIETTQEIFENQQNYKYENNQWILVEGE